MDSRLHGNDGVMKIQGFYESINDKSREDVTSEKYISYEVS